MSGPTTVKLDKPIEFGQETIAELTFREGRFGDLKGVDASETKFEEFMMLASRLSGQPLGLIEKLSPPDAGKVIEVVRDFLEEFRPAGSKPSPS